MSNRLHWAFDGSKLYNYNSTLETKSAAVSQSDMDILDGDAAIASYVYDSDFCAYRLVNFPIPVNLTQIYFKHNYDITPFYIYTSTDSTDGLDGTWALSVNSSYTANSYSSYSLAANNVTWIRISASAYNARRTYCLHIFGEYATPRFEFWDSAAANELTGDYPLVLSDAPNTSDYHGTTNFRIKNTDGTNTHNYSLTIRKVKYTADDVIASYYTLSKDGGSTKNATITLSGVAGGSCCSETLSVWGDVTVAHNPADGYHYFVIDVTETA